MPGEGARGPLPPRKRDVLTVACAALLVVACAWAVFTHLTCRVLPEDDAYITYRYAANLRDGRGLVYNAGERVFGSSTPLYVAWLALLGTAFPQADLATLAVRTNALWYVAAVAGATAFLLRVTGRPKVSLLAGALLAGNPQMLDISTGGMEPFLLVALILWGLVALSYGRMRGAALAAGLACVCRPEGGILGVLWVLRWLGQPRKDWPAALLAAAAPVAWLAFSIPYFGSPVPHSLVAKSAPLYAISSADAMAAVIAQLVTWTGLLGAGNVAPIAGVLAPLGITALAVLASTRPGASHARDARHLAVVLVAFVAVYTRPGVRLFAWYLPMLWVPWVGLMVLGACALLPARRRVVTILAALLTCALVAGHPLVEFAGLLRAGDSLPVETTYRLRVAAYREAAGWLAAGAAPGATVMASEIGALGYYWGGHVYDAAALVTPAALEYLPIPPEERTSPLTGAIRLVAVRAVQPDYIVVMPAHMTPLTQDDPWFVGHYAAVASLPVPQAREEEERVVVYARLSDR